ncbi:MAG: DUF192 domain-containing protein [Betaproteobacteria bacterium]|nr:DUF192 domain-containing protein [Betaproteobacteria bacterium]MDH5219881.1 DUF192 domain-containing protein [Betaproteobacteria bacterium]MDH5349619.1 DUF192 domain-containing protein [Betaproteobacteria bacterium]
MKRLLLALLLASASLHAQQPSLPAVQLGAGMHLIRAEVADRDATRSLGLMHRTSLPPNGGMLFVFDESGAHCMWMKNTLLPLSVAFLDEAGAIVNIADMQPLSEATHCAARPARYALEMTQGWFAERGIRAGMRLRGLEQLKPR